MGLITDRMKLYEQALWFAGVTVEEKRFMSENQSSAPIAENKMGTMPVGKLVFNMSLPMMISMIECFIGFGVAIFKRFALCTQI